MDMLGVRGIIFIVAAVLVIISAVLMVTRKNPIHSALWMIVTFFAMAVIYLLLNAQFIAVAQVMVYAGAIMMLIIFVIMLVKMENGEGEAASASCISKTKVAGAMVAVILLVEVLFAALFYQKTGVVGDYTTEVVSSIGNVRAVGSILYGQYLFPFEIASILLLVGIVGAVVIVRRK